MSLAFARDGRHVAVALATFSDVTLAPAAQRLLLLDARTGRTAWRRRYPVRRGQQEVHVRFAPSGALITSAAQGDTIVWNAHTGRILRRYRIGGRPALSPDGHTLALALNSPRLGARSASVGVLDLRTGRRRELAYDLDEEWIMSLAFLPGRQAGRRRRLRRHLRLGYRLGQDRRALPGRADRGGKRRDRCRSPRARAGDTGGRRRQRVGHRRHTPRRARVPLDDAGGCVCRVEPVHGRRRTRRP